MRSTIVILLGVTLVCAGLQPSISVAKVKRRDSQSVLDTPEAHYTQGLMKFDSGDKKGALEEFQEALNLDSNYPGAYLGFALLTAGQGKYDEALRNVNTARKKNKKWIDVYLTKGRVLVMREKKNWLKDALKEYGKARELDNRDDRVAAYEGEAYWQAGQYQEAENAYSNAIDLKGAMQDRAARRFSQVQKARRASPGTKVGIRVARLDPVRRGDLCQLLVEEMKVEELVAKLGEKSYDTEFRTPDRPESPGETSRPEDVNPHWAKSWINRVLGLNLAGLEPYADGLFKPDDSVTRKELARVLQGLLVLINKDEGLKTKYVGVESRFPDVRPDVYYYNAAALVLDRGLMEVDKLSGAFRPDEPVSGAEAVLAIKDLQGALVTK